MSNATIDRAKNRLPLYQTNPHIGRVVIILALGTFAIGVTEFAMMGLMQEAVADLGVPLPSGGQLVSAYAMGAVIGGPILSILCAKVERRRLLLILLGLFAVGHVISLIAPNLQTLIAGRFLSGIPHGAYIATAALLVGGLVNPGKRAQAVSWILAGLTVANVVGVPAVTWLGQLAGWRWMFGIALIVAVVTLVSTLLWVPQQQPPATSSIRTEFSGLASGRLWAAILLAVLGFSGMFALYAYVSPVLTQVAGLPEAALPFVLGLYGVGMVIGTFIGGWAADRSVLGTIFGGLIMLFASLALFAVTAHILPLAIVFLVFVGISGTALSPAMQTHLVDCTPHAPQLSSALNHSAFNLANAFGAWAGGILLSQGWGLRAPSALGATTALLGAVAIGVFLLLSFVRRRKSSALSSTTSTFSEDV